MNPREQLAHDLSIELMMRQGELAPPLSLEEEAECRERLQATLKELGLDKVTRPRASLKQVLSFQVQTKPVATLAAADIVKVSQRFELGVVRLLQSPMRADLAAEVMLDEDRIAEYGEYVFFLGADATKPPVAIIPNRSPVFSGLFADDFSNENALQIDAAPGDALDAVQLNAVKRSRRSLRDPGDRQHYDAVLKWNEA